MVPHKYFSRLPASAVTGTPSFQAAATAATATASRGSADAETPAESVGAEDTTPGGLPRRRSRRGETARSQPAGRTGEMAVSSVPPDASFTGLAAFAAAGREAPEEEPASTGREFTEHSTEESDEST